MKLLSFVLPCMLISLAVYFCFVNESIIFVCTKCSTVKKFTMQYKIIFNIKFNICINLEKIYAIC